MIGLFEAGLCLAVPSLWKRYETTLSIDDDQRLGGIGGEANKETKLHAKSWTKSQMVTRTS